MITTDKQTETMTKMSSKINDEMRANVNDDLEKCTRSEDDEVNENVNEKVDKKLSVPIFRFKLSDDCFNSLKEFSRIHSQDNRDDFKEAFEDWGKNNSTILDNETQRLQKLGYNNDINTKLFRCAKYYCAKRVFNTKSNDDNNDNDETSSISSENKKYTCIPKEFIKNISDHIEANIGDDKFTPATGLKQFLENHTKDIQDMIANMQEKHENISVDNVHTKLKKTYKNKFYQFSKKYGKKI
tara:strand:+ start:582 stop:1304 length:723 start_codon:yes stop_codon:yes gene_type:complete